MKRWFAWGAAAVVAVSAVVLIEDLMNVTVAEPPIARTSGAPAIEKVSVLKIAPIPNTNTETSLSGRRAAFAVFLGLWHGGK